MRLLHLGREQSAIEVPPMPVTKSGSPAGRHGSKVSRVTFKTRSTNLCIPLRS